MIKSEEPLNSRCAFGLRKGLGLQPEVLMVIQTEYNTKPTDSQLEEAAITYLDNEFSSGLSSRKFIDNKEIFPDTLFLMAALKKGWSTHLNLHDANVRTTIFSINTIRAYGYFWKMEEKRKS